MAEHIVAVFKTNDEALAATADLEKAGIPTSAIRKYESRGSAQHQVTEPTTSTSTHTSGGGGFLAWLFGEDTETTSSSYSGDADAYDRRAAAGNVVVSVTVHDDSKIHQAITALEAHHPVEMDETADDVDERHTMGQQTGVTSGTNTTAGREFSSNEVAQSGSGASMGTSSAAPMAPLGTAGAQPGSMGTTPAPSLTDTTASERARTDATASERARTDTTATGTTGATTSREEVIPLAEEELQVGKRTVDRGTTRIRRYVVEKPVEETVTLRGEKVTVERRRPIEGAGTPGSGAFEERVVEVRETTEEPVVSKTAHIAEEVVVGREATERTETVRDTVRREDVEITEGADHRQR